MTLIQSAPIKDRIPSATLSVNELIKLDQAMMVHKILNEQCPGILKQKFTKRSQVSKMNQGERMTCRYQDPPRGVLYIFGYRDVPSGRVLIFTILVTLGTRASKFK